MKKKNKRKIGSFKRILKKKINFPLLIISVLGILFLIFFSVGNHYNIIKNPLDKVYSSNFKKNTMNSSINGGSTSDSVQSIQNNTKKPFFGKIDFFVDDLIYAKKSADYVLIEKIRFSLSNEVAFEKEFLIDFYLYDDNDVTLIRNRPQTTLKIGKFKPGEQREFYQNVYVGFNEINKEKTLKFRLTDELNVIVKDLVINKDFSDSVQVNAPVKNEQENKIQVIPLEIGFIKKSSDFGAIKNMSLLLKNNMDSKQDVTVQIMFFDDNDDNILRYEIKRTLKFPELLPGIEYKKAFPLDISFNELNKTKTIQYKVINSADVVLSDIKYKKRFN